MSLVILLAYAFMPEINKRNGISRRASSNSKRKSESKSQLLAQRTRASRICSSTIPNMSATLARDRLDLMKEGETIYRLESQPGAGQESKHES